MFVRPLQPDDYDAVAAIFAEGIATGLATFETEVPSWAEWDAAHLPEHRFVAELDGDVVGWCAVVPYSRRTVYRGVGEESVYVAERARGRGVGRALLEAVIESARAGGLWTLQAGIFPENDASARAPPPARLPRGRRPRAARTARRRLARRRPARAAPLSADDLT